MSMGYNDAKEVDGKYVAMERLDIDGMVAKLGHTPGKQSASEDFNKSDAEFMQDNWAFDRTRDFLRMRAQGFVKQRVTVADAGKESVAYTSMGDGKSVTIGISRNHEFFDGATMGEGLALRLGLTCHEVMHQIMTPFADVRRRLDRMPDNHTKSVFHTLHNLIEDPAIEYFCPQFIGGPMRSALRYTIKWGYDRALELGTEQTPWQQYINALVQYGDMGPLRGEFTFPEAEEMFMKTVDLVDQSIHEPKGKERVRLAAKLTEITRPLWEKEAQNSEVIVLPPIHIPGPPPPMTDNHVDPDGPNVIQPIIFDEPPQNPQQDKDGQSSGGQGDKDQDKGQKDNQGSQGDKDGKDKNGEGEGLSAKDKLRKAMLDQLKQQRANNQSGKGDQNNGNSDGQLGNSQSAPNDSQSMSDSNINADSSLIVTTDERGSIEQAGNPLNPQKYTGAGKRQVSGGNSDYNKMHRDEEGVTDMQKLLHEAVREMNLDELASSIKAMKNSIDAPMAKAFDNGKEINNEDMPDRITDFPPADRYSCRNILMKDCDPRAYQMLLTELRPQINSLVRTFEQIFRQDEQNDSLRGMSGKFNPKTYVRTGGARSSVAVFDKKLDPGDLRNMCIALCIDHSGSMSGTRIDAAGRVAIVIAEACAQLDIPCYVMGFAERGADSEHFHYVRWSNTVQERQRLANIQYSAGGGNFDSYAIRYLAEEIVKSYDAKHKMMFVISDGSPSQGFTSDYTGDVKDAVKLASKHMDVFGIGISEALVRNADFTDMYGTTKAIDGTDVTKLPQLMTKLLKKAVYKWRRR